MTITANDVLMGGGTKAAAFPTIGATITGRIVLEPKAVQQTDITTEKPKTFSNGDPMMQIIVQLQTDERDPAVEDDDGIRSLYVKSNMLKAIREAVKTAGAKGLEVGGTLTVTYIADGEQKQRGFNAPKLYRATYRPPAAAAANSVLMGGTPAAATPAAGGVPAGVDPAVWDRLDTTQRNAVLAALPAGSVAPY